MIRKPLMLVAATLTMAAAQPAAKPATPAAKPTPSPSNLNCLVVSSVFSQRETDQQRKEVAHQSLLFYLGRLDPRTSAPQLASALKQTADALNGVNAGSLMNECLGEPRTKASLFDSVLRQLEQQQPK